MHIIYACVTRREKCIVIFALCNNTGFQRYTSSCLNTFTCGTVTRCILYIKDIENRVNYTNTEESINLLDRLYLLTIASPAVNPYTCISTRVIDHFAFSVWRVIVNIIILYARAYYYFSSFSAIRRHEPTINTSIRNE